MRKILTSLTLIAFAFVMPITYAQTTSAKLIKNVNVRAKGLQHDLNKSKDTLILKSDKTINYVYSINRNYEKEIYDFIDDKSYKVPLNNLSGGKHTFVVGQSPLKIVFAVFIYKEDDLQTSVSNTTSASTLN